MLTISQTHGPGRRLAAAIVLAAALVAVLAARAGALPPDEPDADAWVPNSSIADIAHAGSRTVVTGSFDWWGPYTGSALRLDPAAAPAAGVRGQPLVGGGDVRAAITDGAGGVYIGGSFRSVDGQPRV